MGKLDERRQEFRRYVWNHSVDPFQTQFDERRALTDAEVKFLLEVTTIVKGEDDAQAANALRSRLGDPKRIELLLQLVGLTRNKIIQDLKAAVRSGAVSATVPSSYDRLPGSSAWRFAGPYLVTRLRKVLGDLDPSAPTSAQAAFEAVNQATWPGFVRQERAKRSGHEAEYRLATLMASCKIAFEPREKAENPLCRDAQISGVSFDVVIPNLSAPAVVVKSTVHTSNIGQYGESKDDLEMREARAMLDENFDPRQRPLLLAFADGVGFESNRSGLDGVLTHSDEFCQFRTIWKGAVIGATRTGRSFDLFLPDDQVREFAEFLARYKFTDRTYARSQHKFSGTEIEAGDGLIVLSK